MKLGEYSIVIVASYIHVISSSAKQVSVDSCLIGIGVESRCASKEYTGGENQLTCTGMSCWISRSIDTKRYYPGVTSVCAIFSSVF